MLWPRVVPTEGLARQRRRRKFHTMFDKFQTKFDTKFDTRFDNLPTAFARRALWVALSLGCLTALPPIRSQAAPPPAGVQAAPPPAGGATALDAGARIHVTMADAPEITGDYTVDAVGGVQMLYAGQVRLAGLTASQASARLAAKDCLGRYYKHPQVVVTLLSPGGITIEVTGAVTTQGPRPARTDTHLNDVLQQAVPASDAWLDRVQITHGRPGDTTHPQDTVDYLAFLNGQAAAGNPPLQDGDVIFVPRKDAAPINVVVRGQVARPGQAAVPAKTTVYDTLQAAGGLLPDADRRGISVQHAGATEGVAFDYDAALRQPNDPQINPVLRDGDAVIVAAAAVANAYTITGAVRSPAEYPLTNAATSLADAIGRAGGLAERPKLKEVTIVRKAGKGPAQTVTLDASDLAVQARTVILPGDNISIPQGTVRSRLDPLSALGSVMGILSIFRR